MQNDWNFHHTRPGNREGGVLTVKWLMFLVFNKAGRHINDQFNFKNDIIQHASSYRYLGLNFTLSESFKQSENELYSIKQLRKAYFKLRKDFLSFNPNIPVFDHTIKPILVYGSELWGAFRTDLPKFRNGISNFVNTFLGFIKSLVTLPSCPS